MKKNECMRVAKGVKKSLEEIFGRDSIKIEEEQDVDYYDSKLFDKAPYDKVDGVILVGSCQCGRTKCEEYYVLGIVWKERAHLHLS